MSERVCVILNPASGRGCGARALPPVRAAFAAVGVTTVWTTTAVESEELLAQRAIEEGYSTLVAVGGDGTWSNVANAILSSGAACRLALIAAGTGNDFVKTAGVPAHDITASARLAAEGGDERIDVGRVDDRFFLNALGVGFDVAVLERCARTPWLRGNAVYVYSAVRELAGYDGVDVDVGNDGAQRHLLLVIANGQRFGGTFHIAPQASLRDGLLDVIAIRDASAVRRVRMLAAAVRGAHVTLPNVRVDQASSLTLRFGSAPAFEADGEYHQAESNVLRVSCVPAALRLVGAAKTKTMVN